MPSPRIRPLVFVCQEGDRMFFEHGRDRVSGRPFHRAIGGGIEFGERAADAARREWMEELGIRLGELTLLGVIENLFEHEGEPGHEIVVGFSAETPAALRGADEVLEIAESGGQRHAATWVSLAALAAGPAPRYPAGIVELLRRAGSADRSRR